MNTQPTKVPGLYDLHHLDDDDDDDNIEPQCAQSVQSAHTYGSAVRPVS